MPDQAMQFPVVSVIISTYNYGHLIGETLESLQGQTFRHWECIVIDDGSSDNTREVMTGYVEADNRIKYIPQQNTGMSAARNRGIAMARGQYIQLLDADDLLSAKKFEQQVQYLEQYPEADLVYGDVKYFYSNQPNIFFKTVTGTQQDWMPRVSGKGEAILSKLIVGNIMAINCPLIRAEVFRKFGAFNETLRHNEDWELFLRWAVQGVSFYYQAADNTEALVRMHSTSASRDKWNMRYYELELKESIREQPFIRADALTFEIDKLRLSLLFITFSTLLRGQVGKAGEQWNLFLKKNGLTALRRNGINIILGKIKTFVSQKYPAS
ncbi:glycosyltransferase [Pontibacter sp. HSC-14F20]|nr:glycosyltransferase [Pontibacter sp. HSC-14F20]